MKILKTIILALLIIMLLPNLSAQMNNWITPDYSVDVTTIPFNPTLLPGKSGPTPPANLTPAYSVANGAYDENNNLLFYVEDDQVYDANGILVGPLGEYDSQCSGSAHTLVNTEIVIVPVLETCNEFYVIYGMTSLVGGTDLVYIKVTTSAGGTPSITYNGSIFVSCGGSGGFVPQAFRVAGHGNLGNLGIAVSKLNLVADKRYLYTASFTGIVKSDITSSGIGSGTTIASTSTLGADLSDPTFSAAEMQTLELELSWGEGEDSYLAWTTENASSTYNVFVIQLNNSGNYTPGNYAQGYSVELPKGIEFDADPISPNLFVSAGSGLNVAIWGTPTISSITTTPYNLKNTFLEYAKNGLIYGFSPTISGGGSITAMDLVGVDPNSFAVISFSNVLMLSEYTIMAGTYADGVHTLPDQIDGEDYNYFKGVEPVSLNTIEVNSTPLSTNCTAILHEFCQDEPLLFYSIYNGSGSVQQYKIEIEAVDEDDDCVTLSLDLDYNGTWQPGALANGSDLKLFTDFNGNNLGNSNGVFRMTYYIEDECGAVFSETRYFRVIEPLPVNTLLEIYNKNNSQTYLAASTNINNPVSVGSSSIGYRINNSTGTIESLSIEVNEVDNSGNWVKDIYEETKSVSGVSSYTYEALNTYCVNQSVWPSSPGFGSCTPPGGGSGYTGYFAYNNGQYSYLKYFEIIVTLSNQCNSSQASSYVYVDSRNNLIRYDNGNSPAQHAKGILQPDKLRLYPNPTSNAITVEMQLEAEAAIEMVLMDVTGKKVRTLETGTLLPSGFYKQKFDISDLPSGIYLYQIKSNTNVKSGMISVQ